MNHHAPGFNSHRPDPVSEGFHPGNGYRHYSPTLMRFCSPDSWSPFGAGGINPWTWCMGDPVNLTDPSGHMSWQSGVSIGLGIVGVAMTAFTFGTSLAAAGSLSAALAATSAATLIVGTSALMADVTGLASAAMEDSHPQASAALGWTSLAAGVLSVGIGLSAAGGRALYRATTSLRRKLVRVNGKLGIPMSGEFRNARFLGANHSAGRVSWNIHFEDTIPMGRRLTVVMSSVREGARIKMMNEFMVNDIWASQTLGPTSLRNMVLEQGEHFDVYRLIIPDSARPYTAGGQNIAMEFRNALSPQRSPVVAYRGVPGASGPVIDALQFAYDRVATMERQGVAWGQDSAQNVLDILSAHYGGAQQSITFQGESLVYPLTARGIADVRNWL